MGATAVHPPSSPSLPEIVYCDRHLSDLTHEARNALLAANNPPALFLHGERLCRLRTRHGSPVPESLTPRALRNLLARAAKWFKIKDAVHVPGAPPLEVVHDLQALPELGFPSLRAVTAIPVFALDGSLDTRNGYNPATETFLHLDGAGLPPIPERPSPEDIATARDLLVRDLLGDFPFADQASRAAAVAGLLTFPARLLIDGLTPLHLIEAPTPGSGKTLLAEVIHVVATGRPAEVESEGEARAEWRKRITAKLLTAPAVVLFDNLSSRLDDPALAAALTTEVWSDRILGSSRQATIPKSCVWLATANNPRLSDELARRTVPTRLVPDSDRPHLRQGFRHRDLVSWVRANRPRLVWAALVMVRAWIVAGKPSGARTLGRFESWARVLGGILEVAGIPGLLSDRADFDRRVNAERNEWVGFVRSWFKRFGDRLVTAGDLTLLAREEESLEDVLGGRRPHSQKIILGKALDQKADQVIGTFRIERDYNDFKGRKLFRLCQLSAAPRRCLEDEPSSPPLDPPLNGAVFPTLDGNQLS
jgi:hypothetical protein